MANFVDINIAIPDDFMAKLERTDVMLRRRGLRTAVNAAAKIAAKAIRQKAPAPGYKGDKPNKMSLKDSIGHVARSTNSGAIAFAGPVYPAGAHAHLVEYGHAMVVSRGPRKGQAVGTVAPHPFVRPAAEESREAQRKAMFAALDRLIARELA